MGIDLSKSIANQDVTRILFITLRGLGDAVIISNAIRQLKQCFPELAISVLCNRGARDIFKDVTCYVVDGSYSSFQKLRFFECKSILKACIELRSTRWAAIFNFPGDLREEMLGTLIGGEALVRIAYPKIHPLRNTLYQFSRWGSQRNTIRIPHDTVNIYAIIEFALEKTGVPIKFSVKASRDLTGRIGLHPFANQPNRMWGLDRWIELGTELRKRGFDVALYGSINDKIRYSPELESLGGNIPFLCFGIADYCNQISRNHINITVDSFAAHASFTANSQTIVLSGSNNYEIWRPITAKVITSGMRCRYFPCYNRPKCEDQLSSRYCCISDIEVADVLREVDAVR